METKRTKMIGWWLVLLLSTGCGVIDLGHNTAGWRENGDDDNEEDPSGIAGGGEEQASGRDAYSLSSVPDFSGLGMSDPSFSTAKAVVGTPPPFSSIESEDIDTYFFGSSLKQKRGPWFPNRAHKKSSETFYEGLAKCELMQKNSDVVAMIDQSTRSLCSLKKAAEDGVFTDKFGNIERQELLFTQEEETKVIRVRIRGGTDVADYGLIRVVGSRDTTHSFDADLLFCSGRPVKPMEVHRIVIDQENTLHYKGKGSFRNRTTLLASRNVDIQAKLQSDEDGNYSFDPSTPRSMQIAEHLKGTMIAPHRRQSIDQSLHLMVVLSAAEEEMMARLENREADDTRFNIKHYSLFDIAGGTFEDLAFMSGAAAISFSVADRDGNVLLEPMDEDGEPMTPVIGTEYRRTAYPRYVTVDDTDLVDIALDAAEHFSDAYPSQLADDLVFDYAEPEEVDDDDDFSDRIGCNEEITHDVIFDMSDPRNEEAVAACAFDDWPENICAAAWEKMDVDMVPRRREPRTTPTTNTNG